MCRARQIRKEQIFKQDGISHERLTHANNAHMQTQLIRKQKHTGNTGQYEGTLKHKRQWPVKHPNQERQTCDAESVF